MSSSVFDFLQMEMQMAIEIDRKHKLRGCHVMKQVREAFRVFDKEGNGFITSTDLVEVKLINSHSLEDAYCYSLKLGKLCKNTPTKSYTRYIWKNTPCPIFLLKKYFLIFFY